MASDLVVQIAIYGALDGGNENESQAVDVTALLQAAINNNQGIVNISNSTMGGDPSPNNTKCFAAAVALGQDPPRYFACQEGQTIDFYHTGTVNADAAAAATAG